MSTPRPVRFPPPLQKGDRVALVVPAGPVGREELEGAADLLARRGFEVLLREDAHSRERYLAGSDERRLGELADALTDPGIRGIFLARGGYGIQRILPRLDLPDALPPKAVVGFSDNTALLGYLRRRLGWAVLHGPHPRADYPGELDECLACLGLDGAPLLPRYGGLEVLKGGPAATARVGGGCLAILSSSVGTPYGWKARGGFLFLEDIAEPPYRLDRMLHHLKASGALEGAKGILFGEPATFSPEGVDPGDVRAVLEAFAREVACSVAVGLPAGHVAAHRPLPFGPRARFDPARGELSFLEPLVR